MPATTVRRSASRTQARLFTTGPTRSWRALGRLMKEGVSVGEVWDDWRQRIRELVPVWACSEVVHNPESTLLVLMLEGYLEVDLGFISLAEVTARLTASPGQTCEPAPTGARCGN